MLPFFIGRLETPVKSCVVSFQGVVPWYFFAMDLGRCQNILSHNNHYVVWYGAMQLAVLACTARGQLHFSNRDYIKGVFIHIKKEGSWWSGWAMWMLYK